MAQTPETKLKTKVQTYLKTITGMYAIKIHGGRFGTGGIPDILCCYKGRFLGIELKVGYNKPSKLQEESIRQINECGGIAIVAYSLEEVKEFMEKVLTH